MNASSPSDDATTERKTFLSLPDEIIVEIINYLVKSERPLSVGNCTEYQNEGICRTNSMSKEVGFLLRPFQANHRLFDIAKVEVYRINRSLYIINPNIRLYKPQASRPAHIEHLTDTRYARKVTRRIPMLLYQAHWSRFLKVRYEHFDHGSDVERCAKKFEQLQTLTVSMRHDCLAARTEA